MADRNAASVLPLPVGAQISVCSPAVIGGHPWTWAAVGSGNDAANQARTAGENAPSTGDQRWGQANEGVSQRARCAVTRCGADRWRAGIVIECSVRGHVHEHSDARGTRTAATDALDRWDAGARAPAHAG